MLYVKEYLEGTLEDSRPPLSVDVPILVDAVNGHASHVILQSACIKEIARIQMRFLQFFLVILHKSRFYLKFAVANRL